MSEGGSSLPPTSCWGAGTCPPSKKKRLRVLPPFSLPITLLARTLCTITKKLVQAFFLRGVPLPAPKKDRGPRRLIGLYVILDKRKKGPPL